VIPIQGPSALRKPLLYPSELPTPHSSAVRPRDPQSYPPTCRQSPRSRAALAARRAAPRGPPPAHHACKSFRGATHVAAPSVAARLSRRARCEHVCGDPELRCARRRQRDALGAARQRGCVTAAGAEATSLARGDVRGIPPCGAPRRRVPTGERRARANLFASCAARRVAQGIAGLRGLPHGINVRAGSWVDHYFPLEE